MDEKYIGQKPSVPDQYLDHYVGRPGLDSHAYIAYGSDLRTEKLWDSVLIPHLSLLLLFLFTFAFFSSFSSFPQRFYTQ